MDRKMLLEIEKICNTAEGTAVVVERPRFKIALSGHSCLDCDGKYRTGPKCQYRSSQRGLVGFKIVEGEGYRDYWKIMRIWISHSGNIRIKEINTTGFWELIFNGEIVDDE